MIHIKKQSPAAAVSKCLCCLQDFNADDGCKSRKMFDLITACFLIEISMYNIKNHNICQHCVQRLTVAHKLKYHILETLAKLCPVRLDEDNLSSLHYNKTQMIDDTDCQVDHDSSHENNTGCGILDSKLNNNENLPNDDLRLSPTMSETFCVTSKNSHGHAQILSDCQDVRVNLTKMEHLYGNIIKQRVSVKSRAVSLARTKEVKNLQSAFVRPNKCSLPFVFKKVQSNSLYAAYLDIRKRQETLTVKNTEKKTDGKHFECTVCSKTFTSKRYLVQHTKRHGVRDFKCATCSKEFPNGFELNRHMDYHRDVKKFKCTVCSRTLSTKSDLKCHMNSHSDVRNFKCTECPKSFKYKHTLTEHLKHHRGAGWKCNLCPKEFVRKGHLDSHMNSHRKVGVFRCTECPKAFKQMRGLNEHSNRHMRVASFECPICGKAFVTERIFNRHVDGHRDVRNFQCDECSAAFKYKPHLIRHLRKHAGIRSIRCDLCPKGFATKADLTRHLNCHSDERNFKCTKCTKSFKHKSSCNEHLKLHERASNQNIKSDV